MPQSKTCSSWLPSCLNLWGSDSPKLASLRSEVLPYFGFFCLWSLIPRSLLRGVFISGLADRLGGVPLLYPHVSSGSPMPCAGVFPRRTSGCSRPVPTDSCSSTCCP
jgi:hypothetical protein